MGSVTRIKRRKTIPNSSRNATDCPFTKNFPRVILRRVARKFNAKEATTMFDKIIERGTKFFLNSLPMVSLALIYAMEEIY